VEIGELKRTITIEPLEEPAPTKAPQPGENPDRGLDPLAEPKRAAPAQTAA
jgi:hypothetical protein